MQHAVLPSTAAFDARAEGAFGRVGGALDVRREPGLTTGPLPIPSLPRVDMWGNPVRR